MRIEMRAQGIKLDQSLGSHIERRIRFALGRFHARIRRVHVLVRDVNGPKGGYDINCKVRAELPNRSEIVINELDKDPFSAVARASERVSHAVSRRIAHIRNRRRDRARRFALEHRS